jgi:hypothetical protein
MKRSEMDVTDVRPDESKACNAALRHTMGPSEVTPRHDAATRAQATVWCPGSASSEMVVVVGARCKKIVAPTHVLVAFPRNLATDLGERWFPR